MRMVRRLWQHGWRGASQDANQIGAGVRISAERPAKTQRYCSGTALATMRGVVMRKSLAIALLGLLGVSACAFHEPRTVFRSGVFIGERGISVPLPPPSLLVAPQQEVEVEGQVTGDDPVPTGTIAHVVDNVGGAEGTATLSSGATGFVTELFVDLQNNCLEVWLETPDGATTQPAMFHTVLGDDDTIIVLAGCPG